MLKAEKDKTKEDFTAVIIKPYAPKEIKLPTWVGNSIQAGSSSPNSKLLACAGTEYVHIWDMERKFWNSLKGHSDRIMALS